MSTLRRKKKRSPGRLSQLAKAKKKMHLSSMMDLSVEEEDETNGVGISESTMDLNLEALELTGNVHIVKKLKKNDKTSRIILEK